MEVTILNVYYLSTIFFHKIKKKKKYQLLLPIKYLNNKIMLMLNLIFTKFKIVLKIVIDMIGRHTFMLYILFKTQALENYINELQ